MTPDERSSVALYLVTLLVWNVGLSIAVARAFNLIDRLDTVVAKAFDALGFPRKPSPAEKKDQTT